MASIPGSRRRPRYLYGTLRRTLHAEIFAGRLPAQPVHFLGACGALVPRGVLNVLLVRREQNLARRIPSAT